MRSYLLIFLLFFSVSSAFPALTAKVDKKKIGIGDTLTLTITSDNAKNNAQPDLSSIENDFNIISSEHQVSYNIINNVTSATNQWIFILLPKKEGRFTFSPLTMGNETTTSPLNVEVTLSSVMTENQPTSQDAPGKDVFIKVITSSKTAFINEQILYTVRVYSRRHLINIDYTPPQAENALMLPLAQIQPYQISLHGDIYAVEELQYAIFANHRGTLTITPPQLKGMTYDMLPQPIQASGPAVKITINPPPTNAPNPFLPAQSFLLSEKYEPDITTIKQGDTLIRTLKLSAEGIPSSLLPIPNLKGKDYSVYPTQPILKNHPTKNGIKGMATIAVTYLFNKKGTYTLPALTIPWFDTINNKIQTAALPAHQIIVGEDGITTTPKTDTTAEDKQRFTQIIPTWLIILIVALLGLLLLLITLMLYQRGMFNRAVTITKIPQGDSFKKIYSQLHKACLASNAKETQRLLLKWANLIWQNQEIINISQIGELSHNEILNNEINKLSAYLYGNQSHSKWDGQLLWKAITSFNKNKGADKKKSEGLPQLNP